MREVEDILKELTVEEKASLCQGASFWMTKEIKEKGVPEIMVTDGPHGLRKQTGETDHLGVNKSVPATCFPSSAAVCNSWDTDLMKELGEALGEECLKEQVSVLLGPGANIKRSPLCGRNFEYFSEDPYLSSQMAKNHILGVQSKGIGTSLKHFALNNQETRRMTVDVRADERTLREIYLASFETAVKEAKPWTVMAAYNKVNGEFCCENHHLVKEILREEWGYDGVLVSDWGAANDQIKGIKEGFDLRMPYAGEAMAVKIVDAVKNGQLTEEELDASVRRILTLIKKGTENKKEDAVYDVRAHHLLARKAAEESAVLLKNEQDALPIEKNEKLALIGALAKYVRYQGGGSSHVIPTSQSNVLEVLDRDYPDVSYSYARGYRLKKDRIDEEYKAKAVEAAKKSDKVVVFIGLPDGWESEGFDRTHMRIPENQIDLLKALHETGKPVIALLFAGAPVEMPWITDVDALFAMYTGGQAVSEATVRLLLGEANPCGKLSETYPICLAQTPCSLTYPQKETAVYEEGIFVGYRYYEKKNLPVQFAFGHGLSYTGFAYRNLKIEKEQISDQDTVKVSFDVKNTGKLAGKEIVQLYVRDIECSVPRPVKELKGFVKVFLNPGETKRVEMELNKRSFAFYNTELSDWYAETGDYEILVGASSDDIRLTGIIQVTSTQQIRKKYDEYVTMGELMQIPAAAGFVESMMQMTPASAMSPEEMEAYLEDEDDQREIAMDYGAMGMDMPLVKVADMSVGQFPPEMVQQIVNMINQ